MDLLDLRVTTPKKVDFMSMVTTEGNIGRLRAVWKMKFLSWGQD